MLSSLFLLILTTLSDRLLRMLVRLVILALIHTHVLSRSPVLTFSESSTSPPPLPSPTVSTKTKIKSSPSMISEEEPSISLSSKSRRVSSKSNLPTATLFSAVRTLTMLSSTTSALSLRSRAELTSPRMSRPSSESRKPLKTRRLSFPALPRPTSTFPSLPWTLLAPS